MIYFVKYLHNREVRTSLGFTSREEADRKVEEVQRMGYPAWVWEEDQPSEHEMER